MVNNKSKGFTALELIVSVTIFLIIAVIAVPSFYGLVNDMRADSEISKVNTAIQYARVQALSRGMAITLCKSQDKRSCGGSWSDGLMVFIDKDNTHQVSQPENILRVYSGVSAFGELSFNAFAAEDYLQILPTGLTNWQNGTFVYCAKNREARFARSLIISNTGRIRETKGDVGIC